MTTLPHVTLYTDGSALGNPGPGGYGTVLMMDEHRKELSGGFRLTTNNRMEILAVIKGLEALQERCHVELFSDSQYVINGIIKGWAKKWKSRGWMRNKTDKAINPDLWDQLLTQVDRHDVAFNWVRGHTGVEENERADRLAVGAAQDSGLAVDEGYEAVNGRMA
ncbi:MAG: ribonuclease HI [SAR202 cluster bacterium]|jgi:ribonuclease HI|nr:ribonuclease HI [SAR202 cluster bacterium]